MSVDGIRRRAAGLLGTAELVTCEQRVDRLEVAFAENSLLADPLAAVVDALYADVAGVLERRLAPEVGA